MLNKAIPTTTTTTTTTTMIIKSLKLLTIVDPKAITFGTNI